VSDPRKSSDTSVHSTQSIASGDPQVLPFDIAANRAARKYSRREQALRILWSFGRWLIILSPHPFNGWRRFVLRSFGARVGHQARIQASTVIVMPWNLELGDWSAIGPEVYVYNLGRVRLGRRATVSYRSHLCAGTHDFSDPTMPLLKPAVTIEDDAWVGTEAFIGPGVTVGQGAMVAARAVVVRDVAPKTLVGGHPAREIGPHPGLKRPRV
jgi:putative colanic acid biosynthesis acetyltransferase WcaF